jgi:hypothetical protein
MRSLILTTMLFLACGPTTSPPLTSGPPSALSADMASPSVCAMPPGTIDKNTPDKGYWVDSGCFPGCLPPHQFFSICTTNAGVLLFDTTTEPQQYAATSEPYLASNPCAATPWRVWQVLQVPTPANPGAWADPSIESDCSKYSKKNTGPLQTGRFYYKTVAEITQAVVQ